VRKKKVITKAIHHLHNNEEDLSYFDELAFAEMMRQVIEHVEELPTNMRNILKKYYLQGKKYKDIANELETSPDAVRMKKHAPLNYYSKSCCCCF
jgi:DNA-directed RNA polymerase specialized sigma24 family protein